MTTSALTAARAGLVSCGTCGLLAAPASPAAPGHCPRCGARLAARRRGSVETTWALVIAAAICYIPANLLPVLGTTTLGSTEYATSEPAAGSAFPLYGDRTTAMKQPDTIARSYVLYFSESLRGLSVGAPLTLFGLPAGEVTQVGVDLDPVKLAVRGRVEVVAYPERIVARLQPHQSAAGQAIVQSEQATHTLFKRLVEERGLRSIRPSRMSTRRSIASTPGSRPSWCRRSRTRGAPSTRPIA
jgi:predicted RNA-binding Zn-ribbon protein involved in translation (DUF1610 family)